MKNIIKNKYIIASCVILTSLLCSCFDREFDAEQYITEYPKITVTDFNPKTARPTAEVTITGTNFLGVSEGVEVSFGGIVVGTDTSILSYSENEMVVKVPEGAMSGDLTVTVYTNSATAADDFTYLEGAVIDSISPSTAGAGESVTVYGEKFGADLSVVEFTFFDDVIADVVSVEDDKIVVTVPEGVRSGNPKLVIDGQTLEVPKFTIPVVGAYFEFLTDNQGWSVSDDATYEVIDGKFNVTYASGKKDADFILANKIAVLPSEFPIIAIAIEDVPFGDDAVFTFTCDERRYEGKKNNWDGVINDKYYYYDLRKDFEAGYTVEDDDEIMIQWTVGGADASQTGYSVDWVQSFQSVEDLRNLVNSETPAGFYVFDFNDDDQEDWTDGATNAVYTCVRDGSLFAEFDYGTYYYARWEYNPISGQKWFCSSNYPIIAFKMSLYDTDGNFMGYAPTKKGNIEYNNLRINNKSVPPKTTYAESHEGVFYFDVATQGDKIEMNLDAENDWFFRVTTPDGDGVNSDDWDNITPPKHVKVEWVRTFATTADLEEFLAKQ